jgi:hypothetical protein
VVSASQGWEPFAGWEATDTIAFITLLVTIVAAAITVWLARKAQQTVENIRQDELRASLSIEPDLYGRALEWTANDCPGGRLYLTRVRNTGHSLAYDIEPDFRYGTAKITPDGFPSVLDPNGRGEMVRLCLPVSEAELPSKPVRLRATFHDGNAASTPMDECHVIYNAVSAGGSSPMPYMSRPCSPEEALTP